MQVSDDLNIVLYGKFQLQFKEELKVAKNDMISIGKKRNRSHFYPQIIIPAVSFSTLSVSERQNVTFNIHNQLLANPPEFPGAR